MEAKKFRLDEFGFEVEIGKVARQAGGAIWFKRGGTVLLSTATSSCNMECIRAKQQNVETLKYASTANTLKNDSK